MANGDPLWLNEFGHILKQGELGSARSSAVRGNGVCKLNENEKHLNSSRVLLTDPDHGCLKAERIVTFKVDGRGKEAPKTFDLRPYKDKGHPGWVWELWEVNQQHWNDPNVECRGSSGEYGYGFIDENGILVGLQDEFTSGWSYVGYLILSQGPYDCTLGGWKCECNVMKYRNGRLTPCQLNKAKPI